MEHITHCSSPPPTGPTGHTHTLQAFLDIIITEPQTTDQHLGDLITDYKIRDLFSPSPHGVITQVKHKQYDEDSRAPAGREMYSLMQLNCLYSKTMYLMGL